MNGELKHARTIDGQKAWKYVVNNYDRSMQTMSWEDCLDYLRRYITASFGNGTAANEFMKSQEYQRIKDTFRQKWNSIHSYKSASGTPYRKPKVSKEYEQERAYNSRKNRF